jgi:CO/xanthine dehydrogenase FAD-binding subunit
MKTDRVHPEYLINIARIPALRYLIDDKGLRIGALTPFQELEKWTLLGEKYTALFEAARSVSRTQIKNMGTVGGNLCNASPAADSAPPLLVLGGRVKLVEGGRERVLPLEDFYVGPGKTVLSPKELLVEVQLPEPKEGTGSAFLKVVRVAADPAKLNVAVAIEREKDLCRDCRIALGSVAPKPFRTIEAEDILKGKRLTPDLIEKTSQRASEEIQPITDVRSTVDYRREVAKVIVRDAVKLAWERAAH